MVHKFNANSPHYSDLMIFISSLSGFLFAFFFFFLLLFFASSIYSYHVTQTSNPFYLPAISPPSPTNYLPALSSLFSPFQHLSEPSCFYLCHRSRLYNFNFNSLYFIRISALLSECHLAADCSNKFCIPAYSKQV